MELFASSQSHEAEQPKPRFECYGCGVPGVAKARCPTCNADAGSAPAAETSIKEFCALQTSDFTSPRPLVNVTLSGIEGQAYLDTGARTSVASDSLVRVLEKRGNKPHLHKIRVTFADGHAKTHDVRTYRLEAELRSRKTSFEFIVQPGAEDNATLLGVDAQEALGVVVNAQQRAWCFEDDLTKHSDYAWPQAVGGEINARAGRKKIHKTRTNTPKVPKMQEACEKKIPPAPASKNDAYAEMHEMFEQCFVAAEQGNECGRKRRKSITEAASVKRRTPKSVDEEATEKDVLFIDDYMADFYAVDVKKSCPPAQATLPKARERGRPRK